MGENCVARYAGNMRLGCLLLTSAFSALAETLPATSVGGDAVLLTETLGAVAFASAPRSRTFPSPPDRHAMSTYAAVPHGFHLGCHIPLFQSTNGLWEAQPAAINTSDWADAWPADTAASAPAIGYGLELPGCGAAPVSEISSGEPLYGEIKLIDKPHGEQLQADAMIIRAVSCNDHQRDLCDSRILADLQAGAAPAAAQNEGPADSAAADGRANADSTATKTTATRSFPLALAGYSYENLRRSLSDSAESPRHLRDGIHGFRDLGLNAANHSFDAGDSTLAFQSAEMRFKLSGAYEALRATHAANLAGLDPAMTRHWHQSPESETPLVSDARIAAVQQPATAARLGVESESPRLWRDSVQQAGAPDAPNVAATGGVNENAPSNAADDAGAGIPACAGAGAAVSRHGGGSGLTLAGLLKQMKRRRRHVGASGNMIDDTRPASTTDKSQYPEALCKIVSFRDTASKNSSSGSSSTAAEDEGGSSTGGMADCGQASSPLSGSEAAPLAQALRETALDEPESHAFAKAVTHAVTTPNPAAMVTAVMRTRVVSAAETTVTLVPAMPAGSEGPSSPESIRRKAVLAALLQSSLAKRRGEGSGVVVGPESSSPLVGFAEGGVAVESTQCSNQPTEVTSSLVSSNPQILTGNAMRLRLPTSELTRAASPSTVLSASAAEQPEESSKPRGSEASKVGEREIREIREKGNKRAKLIARRMHAPHTGLRRVGPIEEYLQARSNAHPTPANRATPSGPEAAAPAAAGSDRAATHHTIAAGSTNPSDPNYRSHNYGNKVIAPKGEAPFLRKYYRCSLHSAGGCRATRTIDVVDGQPEKITFQGMHNHSPPVRRAKRGRRQSL
ncbi:unnamed protein product [Closterium sp. Yama58-4]|nr:unnamed protein product [Closterium sp. Yama58-4]